MGRKEHRDQSFRYSSNNKKPEMGFPKTLTDKSCRPQSRTDTDNTRRQPPKRQRGMGKLAVVHPPCSKPDPHAREVKIKLPTLTYRRLLKPIPPAANDADDDIDPIATPFLTPKSSAKDRGRSTRRSDVERSAGAELIASGDKEKEIARQCSIGSVSIDRRLVTSERNYIVPESQEQENVRPSTEVNHSVRRRISLGDSPQDNRHGKEPSPSLRNSLASLGHSGGLLSNHAVLSMETLRTDNCSQSIPRSHISTRKEKPALQDIKGRSDPNVAAERTQSPCRALSFEDEDVSPGKGSTKHRAASSSLIQTKIVRKATKPSQSRCIGELEEVPPCRNAQRKKQAHRLFGVRNEGLRERERRLPRQEPPGVQREEDRNTERGKDLSPDIPALCASDDVTIKHSAAENKDDGASDQGDRLQGLRRARSPPRLRVQEETEDSSVVLDETPPRIPSVSGLDKIISGPRFSEAAADMGIAIVSSSTGEHEEARISPQVDRVFSPQMNCIKAARTCEVAVAESNPVCELNSDGCLTEPPTPEIVPVTQGNEAHCARRTVTCRSLLVTIPAGALRSPETPESSSND